MCTSNARTWFWICSNANDQQWQSGKIGSYYLKIKKLNNGYNNNYKENEYNIINVIEKIPDSAVCFHNTIEFRY